MLVSVSVAKDFLGITSNASDGALVLLLEAAIDAVETILSRKLGTTTVTDKYNGTGGALQWVKNFPIKTVSSVKINGKSVSILAEGDFSSPGVKYNDVALMYQSGIFPKGFSNVEVTYTAGYDKLPMDLQRAISEIAGLGLKQREHLDVSSKSMAGETISYVMTLLPKSAKEILAQYESVIPL